MFKKDRWFFITGMMFLLFFIISLIGSTISNGQESAFMCVLIFGSLFIVSLLSWLIISYFLPVSRKRIILLNKICRKNVMLWGRLNVIVGIIIFLVILSTYTWIAVGSSLIIIGILDLSLVFFGTNFIYSLNIRNFFKNLLLILLLIIIIICGKNSYVFIVGL